MKMFIILSLFLLVVVSTYPQATPTFQIRVPNATTAFGIGVPIGSTVYNIATKQYYTCDVGTASTATLTTASANFTLVGVMISDSLAWIKGIGMIKARNGQDTLYLNYINKMEGGYGVLGAYKNDNFDSPDKSELILWCNGYSYWSSRYDNTTDTTEVKINLLPKTKYIDFKGSDSKTGQVWFDFVMNQYGLMPTSTGTASLGGASNYWYGLYVKGSHVFISSMLTATTPDSLVVYEAGQEKVKATTDVFSSYEKKLIVESFIQLHDSLSGHNYITLSHTPISGTIQVIMNGRPLIPSQEYTTATTKANILLPSYHFDQFSISYSY